MVQNGEDNDNGGLGHIKGMRKKTTTTTTTMAKPVNYSHSKRPTLGAACASPFSIVLFLLAVAVFAGRAGLLYPRTTGAAGAATPEFALIVRSQDPLLFAPAALKHYSACKNIGAIRILKDTSSVVWNTAAVAEAVFGPRGEDEHGGISDVVGAARAIEPGLWDVLADARIPPRFIELLDARVSPTKKGASAVFLATDDLWIECSDLERAFQAWRNHTDAIVGVMPIGHTLQLDSGAHSGLKYAVSAGLDKHGAYSMVSLNGAFLNVDYLRRRWQQTQEGTAARGASSSSSSSSHDEQQQQQQQQQHQQGPPGCDDVWLNHLAALTTRQPPIYVDAQLANGEPRAHFSAKSSAYLNTISDCLSQLASSNGGKLSLVWAQASASSRQGVVVADQGHGRHHPPTTSLYFPMVDDAPTHARRKYLLSNDRLAGVSVVLVMETKPSEVASAVRHMHSRHSFIREAVVWNNSNETMNHHMFPYDIAVRYVMAPRNYFAYARYLGCLVARYEICYFQHERTRPVFVAGLYAAFLARPDVIVVASDPKADLAARLNMTIFDASVGRLIGLADMDEGAMVHKDLVRQFVDRMSLDESRSLHERATDADLYFTASQPRAPMVLTHSTWTNNKPRVFPSAQRIGRALAFAFTFAPSRDPQKGFVDPASERHKYFKAPCTAAANNKKGSWGKQFLESCAFATSIDRRPRPLVLNLEHNTTTLKPARRYAEMYERGSLLAGASASSSSSSSSSNKNHEPSAALQYHLAVDGDLKTVWRARTPSTGPSFIGLELLPAASSPQTATTTTSTTTMVGVSLWCESEPFTPLPLLQIGFYGQVGYRVAARCTGKWTTATSGDNNSNNNNNNNLHLLKYDCPPMAGVQRVRLVTERRSMDLHVAEFAVAKLDSPLLESAHAFAAGGAHDDDTSSSSTAAAPKRPDPPPDLGPIVYVIHGALDDFLHGDKLAVLEEACQLGRLYPGKVKIVYVGSGGGDDNSMSSSSNDNRKSKALLSLKQLAQTFAVVGSSCDLEMSLSFEVAVPLHAHSAASSREQEEEAHHVITTEASDALSQRRMQVYKWWLQQQQQQAGRSLLWDARVVMFDPHNSPLLYVLRSRSEAAPNTLFVARSSRRFGDDAEESLALADVTTVSSAADLIAQAKGPPKPSQVRRIVYPLRTLPALPEPEDEASIAAIEEVIVLVTPDTTLDDVELFSANALPTLQQRADVRLVNVTHLARDLLLIAGGATSDVGAGTIGAHTATIDVDARVKRPKWSTLSDVVYYVAIYPARALWILESSPGAAYYASLASVGSARFVAPPGAVPHWESRIVAWNATCDWTPEGFASKARELIQGRFAASSSFPDHDHLQKDASNIVVEEWPIKRTGVPFANTVGHIVTMLAEVVVASATVVGRPPA
jgi:hypothetical protein